MQRPYVNMTLVPVRFLDGWTGMRAIVAFVAHRPLEHFLHFLWSPDISIMCLESERRNFLVSVRRQGVT